jgi:hypothetical protein
MDKGKSHYHNEKGEISRQVHRRRMILIYMYHLKNGHKKIELLKIEPYLIEEVSSDGGFCGRIFALQHQLTTIFVLV